MEILSLKCDFCGESFNYPLTQPEHRHPELEIGGVPINLWTPTYDVSQEELTVDQGKKGVLRFCNLLPPGSSVAISQEEGFTPLTKLNNLETTAQVYLKDEGVNPTGSFKDRGMPLLFAEVKAVGKKKAAIPSTGNAGISFVSYANLAGIEPVVFLPQSTPHAKLSTIADKASLILDRDLIESYEHFVDYCRKDPETFNGFPATNISYLQGLKTAAYEVYLQLGGHVPDWLVLPCGSGGNILGYYQGFQDLKQMGLVNRMPRFVPVQIKGADPITFGFNNKIRNNVVVLPNPIFSEAEAIASDTCFNYFKIQDILAATQGIAVSVTDEDIRRVNFNHLEFSSLSIFTALNIIEHNLRQDETVVLVGTARRRGEKYD